MRRSLGWAVAVVACIAWALAAGAAEKEPEAAKPGADELREALAGFRGFLVGQLVATNDEGLVLRVQAVTLVEGCTAKNPGILLGTEAPVQFATEKGEDGKERPAKWLVDTAKQLHKLPAIAFGGFGGEDAVITMNVGGGGNAATTAVAVTTQRMTMRIDGAEVQPDAKDDAKGKPKGPTITGRVQADEKGALVLDRVVPGSAPGATWTAIPRLQMGGVAIPGLNPAVPVPVPPEPKDRPAQF